LTQSAKRTFDDVGCQIIQALDIFHFAFAFGDAGQDFQHTAGSDAAKGTFPAGFILGEIQEEPRYIHHTGTFVHHHHSPEPMIAPVALMESYPRSIQ
jgi:hypothetical protein